MLHERRPRKKQLNAAAAPRYIKKLSLALFRVRPTVVIGLFRSRWRRSKNKGLLSVPSPGDVDTGGSECSEEEEEEEEEFFEDLRRVRRGELISKARVDVPTRGLAGSSAAAAAASSISRVLGLLAKKGGVFSATLVRKAARTTRVHAGKNMVGEEEETGGVEGGRGLCDRRVLVGRRSKRYEDA